MSKLALALAVAVLFPLGGIAFAGDVYLPGEKPKGDFGNFASVFLENHCFDCHDDELKKGDLDLMALIEKEGANYTT